MCWHRQRDAPCAAGSANGARRTVRSWLGEVFPGTAAADLIDDAELVTSELTTNAVNAGCGILALRLIVHDHWLEVALQDDATGDPEIRRLTPTMTSGRGLSIVEALSLGWGVEPAPAGGKTVWSRLAVPPGLTARHRGCRQPKPPTGDAPGTGA